MRNQNRLEGCIIECYIYEEVVKFCNEYLSNVEGIRLFKRVCTKSIDGNSKIGLDVITVSRDLLCQAHRYVLNNTDEIQSYINKYMDYIRHINPTKSRSEKWVIDEHNKSFIKWFQNLVVSQLSTKSNCISETLRWLANEPRMDVLFYRGYPTNDYCFYTKNI